MNSHDEMCESELTSHGYTPCRCDERATSHNKNMTVLAEKYLHHIDELLSALACLCTHGNDCWCPVKPINAPHSPACRLAKQAVFNWHLKSDGKI